MKPGSDLRPIAFTIALPGCKGKQVNGLQGKIGG